MDERNKFIPLTRIVELFQNGSMNSYKLKRIKNAIYNDKASTEYRIHDFTISLILGKDLFILSTTCENIKS